MDASASPFQRVCNATVAEKNTKKIQKKKKKEISIVTVIKITRVRTASGRFILENGFDHGTARALKPRRNYTA